MTVPTETPFQILAQQIEGKVVLPQDAAYDEARLAWNLLIDQRPAAIVQAKTEADVQAAVRFAAAHDLPIGVQNTGHGLPRGCDGSLLIQLSELNRVVIDPDLRLARLQGGARWTDVLAASTIHGLTGLCGSSPHVGVVGFTLGGGYNLLLRKHGLTVDSVREMRLVTCDGEVLTVSATRHPDLFWALLGGGGAFGVVTEMVIELYPHAQIFGGTIFYPAEMAATALKAFVEWTSDLSDEITSSISVMNLPPLPIVPEPLRGRAVVAFVAAGVSEDAEALIAPMRQLGTPIIDTFGWMPMSAAENVYRDPVEPMGILSGGSTLRGLETADIDRLLETVGDPARMPHLKVEFRHLGGASARVPAEATSIGANRKAEYIFFFLSVPNPFASEADIVAHRQACFNALAPQTLARGPLNWIGEGNVTAEAVRAVFDDESHQRLQTVKAQFDCQNRFCLSSIGLK